MTHSTTMRGGALVLIVLLMLSMSMFGVLSMVSANADLNMARKNADWVQTYYRLDSEGTYKLEQARIMVREVGLASLATAGWTVGDGEAELNLSEGVQNLLIRVAQDENGLEVRSWRQWEEGFEYGVDEDGLAFE